MNFNKILNKPLEAIALSADKEYVTLYFQDGTRQRYGVEGDCCSSSWIEHLEGPDDLTGAVITRVEDDDGVPWDGHDCSVPGPHEGEKCGHDCLSVYNTKFYTTKGTVTLEYRNNSNGYYGGYLVEA